MNFYQLQKNILAVVNLVIFKPISGRVDRLFATDVWHSTLEFHSGCDKPQALKLVFTAGFPPTYEGKNQKMTVIWGKKWQTLVKKIKMSRLKPWHWSRVGNLRPAGRIWPAKQFYPACVLLSHPARNLFLWLKFTNNPTKMLFPLVNATESAVKSLSFRQAPFLVIAIKSAVKSLIFRWRPFFGLLEWWGPAGTLLGLDVAHETKRLPTPELGETAVLDMQLRIFFCLR